MPRWSLESHHRPGRLFSLAIVVTTVALPSSWQRWASTGLSCIVQTSLSSLIRHRADGAGPLLRCWVPPTSHRRRWVPPTSHCAGPLLRRWVPPTSHRWRCATPTALGSSYITLTAVGSSDIASSCADGAGSLLHRADGAGSLLHCVDGTVHVPPASCWRCWVPLKSLCSPYIDSAVCSLRSIIRRCRAPPHRCWQIDVTAGSRQWLTPYPSPTVYKVLPHLSPQIQTADGAERALRDSNTALVGKRQGNKQMDTGTNLTDGHDMYIELYCCWNVWGCLCSFYAFLLT